MEQPFPEGATRAPANPAPHSQVVPFSFDGAQVRVITRDGEPWFVLADVCKVLEHSNPSQAASRLDEDERGIISSDTPSGEQRMVIINESGLYSLILTSRKAEAKRFKRWVTGEVLPAIRKTGGYGHADPMKALNDPATLRNLLTDYAGRVESLQAENASLQGDRLALERIARAEGSLGLQAAAKALNIQPKKFIAWMQANGWIYRRHGAPAPLGYSNRVMSGYLEHKVATIDRPDGSEKIVEQVRVTPKGLALLAKQLGLASHDPGRLI